MTSHPETWNPLADWKPVKVNWIRINIGQEDLGRFTHRSNLMGFMQVLGILLVIGVSGALAYWAFNQKQWLLIGIALYIHGILFEHIGEGFHELGHNTVFATRWLNDLFLKVFGLLCWPSNPYLYRLSHRLHHAYTLHQGSDGEDTPNYVDLSPKALLGLFFNVVQVRSFAMNLARLVTLTPTSKGWRARSYKLDTWEQFILKQASSNDRRQVYRFAVCVLVFQTLFVAACLYTGQWFLIVLVTLAPFYAAGFHMYLCGIHQHAACQANHLDFKVSCGDAILDPVSSFLHWRMEYHIEHHMFAAIPYYNLKAFSRFVAAQLPPKEHALPRLIKLHHLCKEKYGNWQNWRDQLGRFKGL